MSDEAKRIPPGMTFFTEADTKRLRSGGPELYGGLQGTSVEKEWWAFLDSVADRIERLMLPLT